MTVVFIIHPVEDVKEQVSKLFYNVLQVGDSAAYRKCKYQSTQAHSGILPTCCQVSVKNKFSVGFKKINNMEGLTIKNSDFESNTISLNTENEKNPIIKFCENGDIFVKGKLVENDLEVVEGMREFLKKVNS